MNWIHFRIFNNGEVYIDNLTSEKIFIKDIRLNVEKDCEQNCEDTKKNVELNFFLPI